MNARAIAALALALGTAGTLAACKKTPTTPTGGSGSGSGSGGELVLAKSMTVSWGQSVNGSGTDVYLATTDETGSTVSHPLGTFPGKCEAIKPPLEDTLLAMVCKDGATGIELDVLPRPDKVVITKLRVDDGVQPDYASREPYQELAAPIGASIKAQ